ncbi:MAG: redoxin domain-containing protein [Bacteroidota bacterium]|nr:redoxin domain-containing protein [Bacteroidota bacterium]
MKRLLVPAALLLAIGAQAQPASPGLAMPDVALEYAEGGSTSAHALAGARGTVLIFWSNECNWTAQYERRVRDVWGSAGGVPIVLVNANDARAFPGEAADSDMGLPYVRDNTGVLAAALGAARTPEVFAFDADRNLVYTGAIDDAAADPEAVTHTWLQDVVGQLSGGQPVTVPSTRPFGCRIKLP